MMVADIVTIRLESLITIPNSPFVEPEDGGDDRKGRIDL
jgi:hypothetical protein